MDETVHRIATSCDHPAYEARVVSFVHRAIDMYLTNVIAFAKVCKNCHHVTSSHI